MRRVIERHQGRVVNAPGDALLAEFPSVVEAVATAVEIQQNLEGCNLELPSERRMHFRHEARNYNVTDDQIKHYVEGLRKAGLDVPFIH